jgi:Zn finger protein HypA/HybF involved in hydrogenase expression
MHNLEKIMWVYEKVKGKKEALVEVGEMWEPEEFKETLRVLLPKAKITIKEIPLKVKCPHCKYNGHASFPEHTLFTNVSCPKCAKSAEVVSGMELKVRQPEAKTKARKKRV